MKKIRGLLYRVGQAPVLTEVEPTLEALGAVVGGYIETVQLSEEIALVCNEGRDMLSLPPNRWLLTDMMRGDFIVVAWDSEGYFVSLSDAAVEQVQATFESR